MVLPATRPFAPSESSTPPLISARGLTKRFGTFTAVDAIDFDVAPAEAFGFLGPNGAGKTSTMRMIGCVSPISGGELSVLGLDPGRDGPRIRARIGVVPQQDTLDTELTVRENLVIYGRYFGMSRAECRRRADELLDFIQLTERANDPVEPLSGGMKRRLTIARALINEPDLLLLDEPTTGLDPRSRLGMWDVIRRLVREGTTLLLTTQYLDEADQLAGRIAVIDDGKVIAEGTPTELKASLGGQRLLITLAEESDASAAAAALRPFATRPVNPNEGGKLMELPVIASEGLATEVVRALDAAGVKVTDIAVRGASLDDVFLTLTGHKAEEDAQASTPEEVAVG